MVIYLLLLFCIFVFDGYMIEVGVCVGRLYFLVKSLLLVETSLLGQSKVEELPLSLGLQNRKCAKQFCFCFFLF